MKQATRSSLTESRHYDRFEHAEQSRWVAAVDIMDGTGSTSSHCSMAQNHAETTRRIAIIGGGVSGLAAANRLAELAKAAGQSIDVTLFESQSRVGGVVGTVDIEGYRVETGADSFITNKPGAIELCKRLGLVEELIPTDARFRRSLVLSRGRAIAVPEGFQLLAPNSLWPVWKSPIFSWKGKLRLAAEPFIPRRSEQVEDESLASFVRRRLGREALERLVQPLVGGIYTSDPEKLSLRATMPRFLEMEARHGSLIRALRAEMKSTALQDRTASGARYGLFTTPRNGVSQLIEVLADRVRQTTQIQTSTTIDEIEYLTDTRNRRYRLGLITGDADGFDGLIIATPAYRAAELLKSTAPLASGALSEIEYASTAIVVSGHQLNDVRHPLDAFGLVVPAIERRNILAVSFTSRKFPNRAPEGKVQLRTFVGGAMQPELLGRSDDEIVSLVRKELEEILGVTWRPEFTHVARWNRAMPQYHVGHLDKIRRVENGLTYHPGISVAGNSLYGVGLPDTIASGEKAAEKVFLAVTTQSITRSE